MQLTNIKKSFLTDKANELRKLILRMINRAGSGHIGGSLSSVEVVTALYYYVMRHDPNDRKWDDRDRFILSKGHCAPVQYAALADCGYFPVEDLDHLRKPGQHLQGHPNHTRTPGLEATTGSLGQGLSIGAGMALGARLQGKEHYIYVLLGDGEIQEGQIWEAAMFANKYKLNKLIAFIDRNYLQTDGHTEQIMPLDPLRPKWEGFGWNVAEIDGHDFDEIIAAIDKAKQNCDSPSVIILNTIKGKGVSFMENGYEWHGKPPNDSEYCQGMEELNGFESNP